MSEIVITGYGVKAPKIKNSDQLLHVLKNGVCVQSIIKNSETDQCIVAGIVEDSLDTINDQSYKKYGRAARLVVAATAEALNMVDIAHISSERIGVVIGTAAASLQEIEMYAIESFDMKKMPLQAVAYADAHTIASAVANFAGATGPTYTLTTGCTSSIDAIALGEMLLKSNAVDVCIVGGTDSTLGQWSRNGFNKIKMLAKEACIETSGVPFCKTANGFVLSEGAGVIILQREKDVTTQKVYGKIKKIVSRNEGLRLMGADTSGQHMLSVFQETFSKAKPTYINSQALGLKANDEIERFILTKTFEATVPITSIKGMLGHMFGAMGIVQVISALLSIEHRFIPPTIKTTGVGFEELPIVFNLREQDVESVGITTHGSSGNNACLLVTKL